MNFFEHIKTITFDVGYTIIFPAESVGASYKKHLLHHGHDLCEKQLESSFFECWLEHVSESQGLIYGTTEEQAIFTWSNLLHKMIDNFPNHEIPHDTVSKVAKTIYDEFSTAKAWMIHPNWEKLFKICKAKGWQVGLISNWDIRLARLLDELELSELVDFQIISAEHAIEKPDKKIFEIAAQKAGCDLNEIVHVGDTFIDDVVGAVESGAKAVWCNHRSQQIDPRLADYKDKAILVDDLSELLQHLSETG